MKNLKYALIVILIFATFYLLGAFIALSFNPSKWADVGRFGYVMLSVATSAMTILTLETK